MAASSGNETEIKLSVASADHARALLAQAGFAEIKPRRFESNLLLDTDAAALKTSRSVLRVRECGGETTLTFKGPADLSARHKTREEIETQAASAPALLAVFARLGYVPQWRYEKFRSEYAVPGQSGVATVDETPIGVYLELEGEANWIDQTAHALGFSENAYINDSYATLFRRYCDRTGREVGPGMVFVEHPTQDLGGFNSPGPKST